MGALQYRLDTGRGQRLSTAVHEAVAKSTETDAPNWVYCGPRAPPAHLPALLPGRAARASRRAAMSRISMTKDGRWILPVPHLHARPRPGPKSCPICSAILRQHPIDGVMDEKLSDPEYLQTPEAVDGSTRSSTGWSRVIPTTATSGSRARSRLRLGPGPPPRGKPGRRPLGAAATPSWTSSTQSCARPSARARASGRHRVCRGAADRGPLAWRTHGRGAGRAGPQPARPSRSSRSPPTGR